MGVAGGNGDEGRQRRHGALQRLVRWASLGRWDLSKDLEEVGVTHGTAQEDRSQQWEQQCKGLKPEHACGVGGLRSPSEGGRGKSSKSTQERLEDHIIQAQQDKGHWL